MAFTPTHPANDPTLAYDSESSEQRSFFNRVMGLGRSRKLFSRAEESKPAPEAPLDQLNSEKINTGKKSRRVVPGLPRHATFKRQNSERRERLVPVEPNHSDRRAVSLERRAVSLGTRALSSERRAVSADRKQSSGGRRRSVSPVDPAKRSAPTVVGFGENDATLLRPIDSQSPAPQRAGLRSSVWGSGAGEALSRRNFSQESLTSLERISTISDQHNPLPDGFEDGLPPNDSLEDLVDDDIRDELEEKWILNLSMHFRDKSPREKFFITYAQSPNLWRRITVSVDYRNAPNDSLEHDLQSLVYQRDKSARIYESIRSSLPDIQFYDTVTNLRLETSDDDRLHVHVTEDVNEIIPYPSTSLLDHIGNIPRIAESEVHFDSHMSGFVYKVQVDGETLVKKEIPGPDSVEEFLYEINALYKLRGVRNVVQFKGLVVDDDQSLVKGILIAYAEKGPLVDLIYDYKDYLDWERRERWAKEIVQGLAEIHETGFVQGDFTLSNIVIDDNDTAIIIDINRRGCPVGWEPPEIATMIASGQRISMYIGVKSDLFQLGMVLWALANVIDEPERQEGPLRNLDQRIPQYYRDIVKACLATEPRDRASATSLLSRFPQLESESEGSLLTNGQRRKAPSPHSPTESIDPAAAVGLEDIESLSRSGAGNLLNSRSGAGNSRGDSSSRRFWDSHTYYDGRPSSTDMPFDGPSSCIVPRRGRSPPANASHLALPPYRHASDNPRSPSESSHGPQILAVSPSEEHKWEELVDTDGRTFLVDVDETPEEHAERLRRMRERADQSLDRVLMDRNYFNHVDSGLGDMGDLSREGAELGVTDRPMRRQFTSGLRSMEHVDSGLADMDLVGIGENQDLKEVDKNDLEAADVVLAGGAGRDLVTVDEHEVVEDFGRDEQQEPRERIAAVDMAFSDRRGYLQTSKASSVNAPTGTNQHDSNSAAQDGKTVLSEHTQGMQRGCT